MMRSKYVEIHPASLIKKFLGKSKAPLQYYAKKIAYKFKGIPYETSFKEFLSQNYVENLLWKLNKENAKRYVDNLNGYPDIYRRLFKLPIKEWTKEIFEKHSLSSSLVNIGIDEEDNLNVEVRTFGNISEEEQRKITEKIEDEVPYSVALVKSSKSPNYLPFLAADYKPSFAEVAYVITDKNCESYITRTKQRKPWLEKGLYIVLADYWGFVVEEMSMPNIKPKESVNRVKKSALELDEVLDEELLNDVLFLEKAFP